MFSDRHLVTYFGIPVSTTHTITGAIVGVGAARKTAAVRWNVSLRCLRRQCSGPLFMSFTNFFP